MGTTLKLMKGGIISIAIFIALTILAGALLKFTAIPEQLSIAYLTVALSLACAFMGLYTGHLLGRRGLCFGVLLSAILLIVILAAAALCFKMPVSFEMLSPLYLIPLSCGGLFGIVGTNMKN